MFCNLDKIDRNKNKQVYRSLIQHIIIVIKIKYQRNTLKNNQIKFYIYRNRN
jgi:hypothetical protein